MKVITSKNQSEIIKRKRAFSLLEMLVVLAIVAVLMSLGISSLIDLRNRTMLKQSLDNLIQNFNTVRNSARNSVLDRGKIETSTDPNVLRELDKEVLAQADQMDYYAIFFNFNNPEGDYYKGSCKSGSGNTYTCTFDKGKHLKGSAYEKVKVLTPATAGNNCDTIIFNMGKGNINYLISQSSDIVDGTTVTRAATAVSSNTCNLEFSFKDGGSLKLDVELNKQNYDFKIL